MAPVAIAAAEANPTVAISIVDPDDPTDAPDRVIFVVRPTTVGKR
ncbi:MULTISPECIES: hypothetical protein [Nocardia]|nr:MULTISPECIES: hypothetical protein [Nocardia]